MIYFHIYNLIDVENDLEFAFNNYFHRTLFGDNRQHACARLVRVLFHYLVVVQILFVAMTFPCYANFSSINRAMICCGYSKNNFNFGRVMYLRYEQMCRVRVCICVCGWVYVYAMQCEGAWFS